MEVEYLAKPKNTYQLDAAIEDKAEYSKSA